VTARCIFLTNGLLVGHCVSKLESIDFSKLTCKVTQLVADRVIIHVELYKIIMTKPD
jgi:hypothetical protein